MSQQQIQWNPVNTYTNGTCHSVRIIGVSVLSGLSEIGNVRDTCFVDKDQSRLFYEKTLFNFLTVTVTSTS